WVLAAPSEGPHTIAWLGKLPYPMKQGAAATIYFGERRYQFPLGQSGLAVATVVFPLLSKHVARGNRDELAADLTLGLRLVLWSAVPRARGLVRVGQSTQRVV